MYTRRQNIKKTCMNHSDQLRRSRRHQFSAVLVLNRIFFHAKEDVYDLLTVCQGDCTLLAPTFLRRRLGADVLAPRRFGADVLAPIQFGAKMFGGRRFGAVPFWRRDILAPIRFGAGTVWRPTFWRRDVLAPDTFFTEIFGCGILLR